MKRPTLIDAILFYADLEKKNGTPLSPGAHSLLFDLIKLFNRYGWKKHPITLSPTKLFELARVKDRKTLTKVLRELSSAQYPYIVHKPGTGGKKNAEVDLVYLIHSGIDGSEGENPSDIEQSPKGKNPSDYAEKIPLTELSQTEKIPPYIKNSIKNSCIEDGQQQNILFFGSEKIVKLTSADYEKLLAEYGEDALKGKIDAYVKYAESKPREEWTNFDPEYCFKGVRIQRVEAPKKVQPSLSPEDQKNLDERRKEQEELERIRREEYES